MRGQLVAEMGFQIFDPHVSLERDPHHRFLGAAHPEVDRVDRIRGGDHADVAQADVNITARGVDLVADEAQGFLRDRLGLLDASAGRAP